MHVSLSMRVRQLANAGPPHTRAHVLRPCARARVRVRLGAHASAPAHASAFRRRRPRVARLQAFYGALAFNADIGAWNTAAVTTLSNVCAGFQIYICVMYIYVHI